MTLQEFKAWFEGFTENMDGTPNAKQWKRIQAKISDIDGTVTSYPIFIDRYVKPYFTSYPPVITCDTTKTIGGSDVLCGTSIPAWQAAGKQEFKTVEASQ